MNSINTGLLWAALGGLFTKLPGLFQIYLSRRQTPAERTAAAVAHEVSAIDILKDITAELRTELERNLTASKARWEEEHARAVDLQGQLANIRLEVRAAHTRVAELESVCRDAGIVVP